MRTWPGRGKGFWVEVGRLISWSSDSWLRWDYSLVFLQGITRKSKDKSLGQLSDGLTFLQVYKRKQKPAVDRLCVGIPRGEVIHEKTDVLYTFCYIRTVVLNVTFLLVVFWITWCEWCWKNEYLQNADRRFGHHERGGSFSWQEVC